MELLTSFYYPKNQKRQEELIMTLEKNLSKTTPEKIIKIDRVLRIVKRSLRKIVPIKSAIITLVSLKALTKGIGA